jgi:hypothetical protein
LSFIKILDVNYFTTSANFAQDKSLPARLFWRGAIVNCVSGLSMRVKLPTALFGAIAAAAIAVALPGSASAQMRMQDIRACSTQRQDLADERVAACTGMINSGYLRGEASGVAYSLRGLAFLDRGDIPHAVADLDQAVAVAPDFAPPIRTAAMPGMRAAITGAPSPITTRPSSSIPIRPRLTSTAPPCGATSAISTARWKITRRR